MELRQIKYFVGIAETGSFTKAAAVLDIAQPALSRQIRELEDELGIALLIRNGRGIALTDAGVKFLSRAKMLLEDAERALQEARSLKGHPMGLVSIGMVPSIGTILSIPIIERVKVRYPDIQLQLTEGYSGHLHEWLLSGRLDIGILYLAKRYAESSFDRLADEHLYLLGAPTLAARHLGAANRVVFADLCNLPLIMPTHHHAIRRQIDELAAKGHVGLQIAVEVNAFHAIRDLVLLGHGFTILPVSNVLKDIQSGRLQVIEICDPALTQTAGLMTSSHHSPSFAAVTVARVIRELAGELIGTDAWPDQYDFR